MTKYVLMAMALTPAVMAAGPWYFEAGPWYRGDMEIRAHGGSHAAEEGVRAGVTSTRGRRALPHGVAHDDDGGAGIFRQFDDGFVGPSGWEWAREAGFTQYWGYDRAGQYSSADHSLRFTRSFSDSGESMRSVSRLTVGSSGWSDRARTDGVGGQLTVGRVLVTNNTFDLSGQLCVGWLDGIGAKFRNRDAHRQVLATTTYRSAYYREEQWVYTYDTLGNPAFPDAPFAMGDPDGIGPMIRDVPDLIEMEGEHVSTSERMVGHRRQEAVSRVDLDVNATALVFHFGTRLIWRPSERLGLVVQPGVTLNWLDADAKRREGFAWEEGAHIRSWQDRVDEQKWLWGASLAAGLQWDITDSLYMGVAGGYDHVASHTFRVGPDSVRVNLSGWRTDTSLGVRF